MTIHTHKLIVITGPTGSGKSGLAVELARELGCDIISADSRQIYAGMPIGTAAPSAEQLAAVKHHFVGTLDITQAYSAGRYEADVMALLPQLWEKSPVQILCGGSMMYVDAVCQGIDDLPDISPATRERAMDIYRRGGLQALRLELLALDPVHYREVDLNNPRRLIHAIEICYESGTTYSSLRLSTAKSRPFDIVGMYIDWGRDELFGRINRRVDAMMEQGLENEARALYPHRSLNALNTVGYKEMFAMIDGVMDRATAVARIAKNTRVYAKKQMLWLRKHPEFKALDPACNLREQALAVITS